MATSGRKSATTGKKAAAKKKPAAKKASALKRRTSVKRNSKARQRALDTAVATAASKPAVSAGSTIRLPASKPVPAKKNAEKKSLGQRIRGFVEKRLG